MFERLDPSAVHSGRSHRCRAFREWVRSKDCTQEVRNMGERFVNMFAHDANHVTSMEYVQDAMTLLAYIIVLLGQDKLGLQMMIVNGLFV